MITKGGGYQQLQINKSQPHTDLFLCYNGMMLGYFTIGAFAEYTKEKFPYITKRIQEVLSEIGILGYKLPQNHDDFVATHSSIIKELSHLINKNNSKFFNYFHLGATFYVYLLKMLLTNKEEESELINSLRDQVSQHLKIFGVPENDLDQLCSAAKQQTSKNGNNSTVFEAHIINNTALELLEKLLNTLERDEFTCFVSIPFKSPYIDYFYEFYVPVLKDFTISIIRGWGSFEGEKYQAVMFKLIQKSGMLLADISETNPNVIIEYAYAMGCQIEQVYLTANKNLFKSNNYSNINDSSFYKYDPCSPAWPKFAITEFRAIIGLINLGIEIDHSEEK